MADKAKRKEIIALATNSSLNSARCVAKQFIAGKQFQETSTTSGKPIAGRTRSFCTNTPFPGVKKKIEQNPQRSVKKNALDAKI